MKKWWIVLAAVLAIAAAAVVGYMLSTAPRGVESLQATQPETAAPTEPATERPTEPPTEAPTEPPMEAGETLVLNGTELVTAVSDGTEYVSADALQQAGLSLPEAEPLQNGGMDYYVLSAVSEENRCAEYVDDETGLRYLTPGAARFSIEQSVNVPVLMYHAVSDNMWGIDELFVSPASMEEQLRYLVDNGYEPIWFSDLAELEQYEKPVILTFDDGYDDNYTELLPAAAEIQCQSDGVHDCRCHGHAAQNDGGAGARDGGFRPRFHPEPRPDPCGYGCHGRGDAHPGAWRVAAYPDARDGPSALGAVLSDGPLQRPDARGRRALLQLRPENGRRAV